MPLWSTGFGFVGILTYLSMLALLHSGKSITSRSLGIQYIEPSLEVSGELVFPAPALFPLVLSEFLAGQLTSQPEISF